MMILVLAADRYCYCPPRFRRRYPRYHHRQCLGQEAEVYP
jgi:hypothetical protein